MPTVMTFEGIDAAANAIAFAPPVADGLVGWFHVNASATEATRNRAEGGGAGIIIGSPTFAAGYGSFNTPENRIDTSIPDYGALTMIAVAKSNGNFALTTDRPGIMGCYGVIGGKFYGSALMVTGTGSAAPSATITCRGGRDDGVGGSVQTGAVLEVPNFSNWTCLAGVIETGTGANARKLYNLTDGTSAFATPATDRVLHPVLKFSIGGVATSTADGPLDLAAAAIYSRALSKAEIDKVYAFLRRRMLDKNGISI